MTHTGKLGLLLARYRPAAWCIDRWWRLRWRRLRWMDAADVVVPGLLADTIQQFLDEHDCCGTDLADYLRDYIRRQEPTR